MSVTVQRVVVEGLLDLIVRLGHVASVHYSFDICASRNRTDNQSGPQVRPVEHDAVSKRERERGKTEQMKSLGQIDSLPRVRCGNQ